MTDSSALRSLVERQIDKGATRVADVVPFGMDSIDRVIDGGLARAKLHEFIAYETADSASASGFAALCAHRIGGEVAWLIAGRHSYDLNPHGLSELGIDPRKVLLVHTPDASALLRAVDEAVRCNAIGVAVIELWGDPQRIDLTVSRRLMLAAEVSGVTPLLLRIGVNPVSNAAQTRWSVRAAPSTPLDCDAPGPPSFDLELLRQRGGPSGMRWRVEWDRDQASFHAPLSGDLAAEPVVRPVAVGDGNRLVA